jgi:hypothetical protein
MPTRPQQTPSDPDDTLGFEPTEAEIEQWANRERERREAWLRGPTAAQRADWAARERARRMGDVGLAQGYHLPAPNADAVRMAQYYMRECQLATEGAVSLLLSLSVRDVFDNLVRAGREWEDEYTSRPARRRRVPIDPDVAEKPLPTAAEAPGGTSQAT